MQLELLDKSIHEYYFKDGKLYYIIREKVQNDYEEKKFITLCEEVTECNFTLNSGKLTSNMTINGKVYTNSFTI